MVHQARKRFGQHFLVDDGVIHQIIAGIRPAAHDHVIEIGPGLGAMTLPLLKSLESMAVVEIDRDLVKMWQAKKLPQLVIYESDALKFDFANWAQQARCLSQEGQRVLIVGNLPYNISSPLLFHLMAAADWVDEQVFMLQAEVVERMVAIAGDSEYGRLSVMLQSRYDMELILDVPPEAFDPPPRVDSAVVRMVPKRDGILTPTQYQALEKVVTLAFAQRRKVLRNNLSTIKDQLGIDDETLALRAQDVTLDQYLIWARKLAGQ